MMKLFGNAAKRQSESRACQKTALSETSQQEPSDLLVEAARLSQASVNLEQRH